MVFRPIHTAVKGKGTTVMGAVEQWATGHSPLVRQLAIAIARSVPACTELLEMHRANVIWKVGRGVGVRNNWAACYRQPVKVTAALWQMFHGAVAPCKREKVRRQLRAWRQESRGQVSALLHDGDIRSAIQTLSQRYQAWVKRTEAIHSEQQSDGEKWLECSEFLFVMAVVVPCWLEHGTLPWYLYRRAANGDTDALAALLQIDPQVAACKRIDRRLFELRQSKPQQYQAIREQAENGQGEQVVAEKLKFEAGGLILMLAATMDAWINKFLIPLGVVMQASHDSDSSEKRELKQRLRRESRAPIMCRLTSRHVKALFDAIAMDTGEGNFDRDFVGESETIRKRLGRNTKKWPDLRKWDISRLA